MDRGKIAGIFYHPSYWIIRWNCLQLVWSRRWHHRFAGPVSALSSSSSAGRDWLVPSYDQYQFCRKLSQF